MPLAHLPAKLADGQDLPHAGRGGRDEVERLGDRGDAADQRQPEVQAQVLPQRRLGVHRHRVEPLGDGPRYVARGPALEGALQVAPWLHLTDERPLSPRGSEDAERRGHGGLADPALTGDEDEPTGKKVVAHDRPTEPSVGAACSAGPETNRCALRRADLDVGDPCCRNTDATTALVGQPQHRLGEPDR